MQLNIINSLKQRRFLAWLGGFAILLSTTYLLYVGYCWGWWGRHNLLLQYYFQCQCPATSEQSRYPKDVDVIVSACHYQYSSLSPSGRFLAVYEKEPAGDARYLLDLQTGAKIPLSLLAKSGAVLLTDNLLYFSISYKENYILDYTDGTQYPIWRFLLARPDAYEGSDVNPALLADVLQHAKYVFLRDDGSLIVLDPEFPASTKNNFLIDRFDIPGENFDRTEQFLKEYNIFYQNISAFPEEVMSPDGRFVARNDGIYRAQDNQKIVDGVSDLSVRGWTNDGRVVYSAQYTPCLFEFWIPMIDDGPSCSSSIFVSQPVIALKVPQK